MYYIGLDPGLTGAIAIILPGGAIEFHDMPVLTVKKKDQLSYAEFGQILRPYEGEECIATIELVGAMPGQGVSSMFKFGQCYGAALATLAAFRIPYQVVPPPTWKRSYRLIGEEKDASRQRALELFPQCADRLGRKKDHGRADALLLAEYGRRLAATPIAA